jgi:hypothetical protein
LACPSTPALSLCASPNLCLVVAAPLRDWLFAPPQLSAFVAIPMFAYWDFGTESSSPCPTPILWGRFSIPPPPPLLVLDYSSLFMFSNFVGGFSLPRGSARLCSLVCDAHLFILQIHTSNFGTGQ